MDVNSRLYSKGCRFSGRFEEERHLSEGSPEGGKKHNSAQSVAFPLQAGLNVSISVFLLHFVHS